MAISGIIFFASILFLPGFMNFSVTSYAYHCKTSKIMPNSNANSFTIVSIILLLLVVGCTVFVQSGNIRLEEPVTAKGVDEVGNPIEPTTVFKATDKRIYCVIPIRGPQHVSLGARWYFGDNLIFDQNVDAGPQQRGVWWLEMAPGLRYPVGKYRIEIYLIRDPVKVVTFKVVE